MIFYAQNANFSQFFSSLASLAIYIKYNLIEIWPKHAKNGLLLQHVNTFNDFLHPPPVDKVHAPPKVKSWIRHWYAMVTHHLRAPNGVYCTKRSYDITAAGKLYNTKSICRQFTVPGEVSVG